MIEFSFLCRNALCITNLSLFLCIRGVLSCLHHQKDDVILPNSGLAKATGGCKQQNVCFRADTSLILLLLKHKTFSARLEA